MLPRTPTEKDSRLDDGLVDMDAPVPQPVRSPSTPDDDDVPFGGSELDDLGEPEFEVEHDGLPHDLEEIVAELESDREDWGRSGDEGWYYRDDDSEDR